MFTGIITQLGTFREYRAGKQVMAIQSTELGSRLEIGDSLAVNGVCLSLTGKEKSLLTFDLSKETLSQTTLGSLHRGDKLNLELSLTLSSPLSGHIVTGHIDGTGKITAIQKRGAGRRMTVSFPPDLHSYFIPKGSVAIDGVSLTIAKINPTSLEVELIPITLNNSNLNLLRPGKSVNIECDIIGKYVYNWVSKTK